MKAWCPSCQEERTVPFRPEGVQRCGLCQTQLTAKPRDRKPIERKSAPKSKPPERDWTHARLKVDTEDCCRLGRDENCEGPLEAAHIIGCDRDQFDSFGNPWTMKRWTVLASRVIPLCRRHHRLYDDHQVDVLPVLRIHEQIQAVVDADGLELARRRTAPLTYRSVAA